MTASPFLLLIRWSFYPVLLMVSTLSFLPVPEDSIVNDISDKLQHFAAFLVLAMLLDLMHPRLYHWYQVLYLAAYGLAIECVQYFLPYRDASLGDWIADVAALLVYGFTAPWLRSLPLWRDVQR